MFTFISLLSPFLPFPLFFKLLLSFLLLGQASVSSSLESEDFEGECRSLLLCLLFFSFFFLFFTPFPRLLLLWQSPLHLYLFLAVLPQFPHPFFNLLCVLSQNLLRNQRNRRRRFRLRRLILVCSFSFSLYFFFAPPPFFF